MNVNHPGVRTFALFFLRVVTGVIFVAHGYQKFFDWGISTVSEMFAHMGIPQPTLSAYVVATLELVGGVLIIVGLLTPIAASLLGLSMVVALYTAHFANGIFSSNGGFEFVLLLIATCFLLVAFGAGKFSMDSWLSSKKSQ